MWCHVDAKQGSKILRPGPDVRQEGSALATTKEHPPVILLVRPKVCLKQLHLSPALKLTLVGLAAVPVLTARIN
jgi:hypothetical protein